MKLILAPLGHPCWVKRKKKQEGKNVSFLMLDHVCTFGDYISRERDGPVTSGLRVPVGWCTVQVTSSHHHLLSWTGGGGSYLLEAHWAHRRETSLVMERDRHLFFGFLFIEVLRRIIEKKGGNSRWVEHVVSEMIEKIKLKLFADCIGFNVACKLVWLVLIILNGQRALAVAFLM